MKEYELVVRNARVPGRESACSDIVVTGGRIVALTEAGDSPAACRVIDASGRWVIPGAIDTHSHIGELAPEFVGREGLSPETNYRYETRSAAAGGVTTALNYVKFGQESLLATYERCLELASSQSLINLMFHGYIMNEQHLFEVAAAVRAGVRTFKVFMPYRGEEARSLGGIGSLNHAQLALAFEAIAARGCQALVHAEDGDIVERCTAEQIALGMPTLSSYEQSRPTFAEGDAAFTAVYLAERARCPLTIVHVSSLETIRARRAVGYRDVTLETCPHYFILTTDAQIGPRGKVAPPIRDAELAAAIGNALEDGAFDFLGSDHNEWPADSKGDFVHGRAGLPGIGLLLPLALTEGVSRRGMSMARLVELTSRNAARRFGLADKGYVGVGADADLVVLDEGRRKVRTAELHSAVDYTPYEGFELAFWPATTICGGRVLFNDGAFDDDQSCGEIINRRYCHEADAAAGRPT